jgi:hypothetical protein
MKAFPRVYLVELSNVPIATALSLSKILFDLVSRFKLGIYIFIHLLYFTQKTS